MNMLNIKVRYFVVYLLLHSVLLIISKVII